MDDADAPEPRAPATGPDWAQFGLVIVVIVIVSLAAVTIPQLGGVGGNGLTPRSGQDAPGSLQDAIANDTGEQRVGDRDSSGDVGDGATAGPDGDRSGEEADGLGDAPGDGMSDERGGGNGDGAADGFGGSDGGEATGPNADGTFDGESEGGGEPDDLEDGPRDQRAGNPGELPADEFDGGSGGEPGGEFGDGSDAVGDGNSDVGGEPTEGGDASEGTFGDESVADGNGEYGDGSSDDELSDGSSDGELSDGSSDGEFGGPDGTTDGRDGEHEGTVGDRPDDPSGSESGRTGEAGSEFDSGSGSATSSDDAGETSDGADVDGDSGGAGYDVSFDESPTPGSDVTVSVTDGGDPVAGARVFFNDEPIGTTDETGRVTGTVPFTETLDVLVSSDGNTERERQRSVVRGGGGSSGLGGGGAGYSVLAGAGAAPRQFHAGTSTLQFHAATAQSTAANETRTTVEMNPETALAIDQPPVAGATVTLSATVNDNPIPQGTVLIDGDERGTTDTDGTARVTLPETPGNATIAVERDEIRAERTVDVRGLSLEVVERVPLPGRTVTVDLQYGNDSAANATIGVDGAAAATTGADGTATVALPIASEATLEAAFEGTTTATTVDGLYRNAALLALGTVGVVLVGGRLLVRRAGITRASVRSLPESLARLVRRAGTLLRSLGRRSVDAIVGLARRLERLGDWLHNRSRDAALALRRAGRWLAGLPRDLADRGLAALAVLHPVRLYRLLVAAVRSLFRSSQQRIGDVAASQSATAESGGGGDASDEDEVGRTLRELWREFVRLVRPPRIRTKTPGEIGRYAVEKGFPEPPVRTVVDVFRDSEYGNASPSTDRLERVRTAVQSVADDSGGSVTDDDIEDDRESATDADSPAAENGGDEP